MKHYDYVEWVLYKKNLLDDKTHEEMEEHLYLCDPCMETFLSLISEEEIQEAGKNVPEDFTLKVMDDIKKIKPIRRQVRNKTNHKPFNDLFIYYVAVASVAIIFTASGFFGKIVDSVPEIGSNISFVDSGLEANKIYELSLAITNKTSKFINEFQFSNNVKED